METASLFSSFSCNLISAVNDFFRLKMKKKGYTRASFISFSYVQIRSNASLNHLY